MTSISMWTFDGCSSLKQVDIPDSVTCIEDGAFDCCTSLTEVKIPNSVTSIGNWAFIGCRSLAKVEIPDSVSIGDGVFRGCSLKGLCLGSAFGGS